MLKNIGMFMAGAALLSACDGLNEREEAMVGNYYVPAMSDTQPILELRADRSATMRAIKPGELTYSVEGRWKADDDSLVIENDASSITIEDGDASLVGTVSRRVAYPIVKLDESTLTVKKKGIPYDYRRRAN